jgi:WD40 repeat protein
MSCIPRHHSHLFTGNCSTNLTRIESHNRRVRSLFAPPMNVFKDPSINRSQGDRPPIHALCARSDLLIHLYIGEGGRGLYARAHDVSRQPATSSALVTLLDTSWSNLTALCVSRNGLIAFCGGFLDGSLKCFLLPSGRALSSICGHRLAISTIAIDQDQTALCTGSLDGSVTIWSVYTRRHAWSRPPLGNGPDHSFFVHSTRVVDVSIAMSLGVAASIAVDDRRIVLYSARRKRLIRWISLPTTEKYSLKKVLITPSARVVVAALNQAVRKLPFCEQAMS